MSSLDPEQVAASAAMLAEMDDETLYQLRTFMQRMVDEHYAPRLGLDLVNEEIASRGLDD